MKKRYSLMSSFALMVVMALVIGPQAHADDPGQFDQMIQGIHTHRAQIAAQLGLNLQVDTYQHATSYYDDLEDHYEQVLIMSDFIDKGIR